MIKRGQESQRPGPFPVNSECASFHLPMAGCTDCSENISKARSVKSWDFQKEQRLAMHFTFPRIRKKARGGNHPENFVMFWNN